MSRYSLVPFLMVVVALLFTGQSSGQKTTAEKVGDVDFARDVRPILSNKCFKCHGPDENTREADLRLDSFEGATADLGDYQAIQPGSPDKSAIIERMTTTDVDLKMPPVDSGLELSKREQETIQQWIIQGAAYTPHWAFGPIQRPEVPVAEASPNTENAIDQLIQRKLSEMSLAPSAKASKYTLIRRLYLDLIGLPPTPKQVEDFVNDASPQAYEKVVDQVLANPHYGEKWGRHWLDQARYADTNGYSVDSERSIWPYRDWVIEAFNKDLPFDQFTIQQIAGDLLENPTQDQLIATGFHRNTLVNQEGGTDAEQFRNEAAVDRVNTTGAVWLGLTVGCAQCHTHKYDPLTHTEYYQLFAFFNSGEDKNSVGPTMSVLTVEHEIKLAEFDKQIATANQALKEYDTQNNAESKETSGSDKPAEWVVVKPSKFASRRGADLKLLDDGSILVSGELSESDEYTITFDAATPKITAIQLETLTHSSLPKQGPGRAGNGNFVLNGIELNTESAQAKWLSAQADHSQDKYDVSTAIDGNMKTGWAINVSSGNMNVNRTALFSCSPLITKSSDQLTFTMKFGSTPPKYNIGRFRISVTAAGDPLVTGPDAQRASLEAELKKHQDARNKFAKSIPSTMVMRELKEPRQSHIHIRGDFLRHGVEVTPNAPGFLNKMPEKDGIRTRLELAHWLVDQNNPLTARVTVNRIWMQLFGRGLVETENDFGFQGTPPTHPELLDWLAAEFRESQWSYKHVIRTIVLSHTYQQASHTRKDTEQIDPLNKFLARQSRTRVDAEIVRDLTLAASGLLNDKIGGKSVYPPQPSGVYAFTQRNAGWPTSTGPDRYRRGMYTFFMRSAPHPMLTTFDTPAFNTTCTRRSRSNTPLQSLTVANDEAMFEMAQALGQRVASIEGSRAKKIQAAFMLCLSRPAKANEVQSLLAYVDHQESHFRKHPNEAAQVVASREVKETDTATLAAWIMVGRVIINLDEFITRE